MATHAQISAFLACTLSACAVGCNATVSELGLPEPVKMCSKETVEEATNRLLSAWYRCFIAQPGVLELTKAGDVPVLAGSKSIRLVLQANQWNQRTISIESDETGETILVATIDRGSECKSEVYLQAHDAIFQALAVDADRFLKDAGGSCQSQK